MTGLRLKLFAAMLTLLATPAAAAAQAAYPAPSIRSSQWINSEALDIKGLHGEVVLVEFWTFGCYNCRNVEPWIKRWHERYGDKGLRVIGVHAPEFDFERKLANLKRYIAEHGIGYAVAVDNGFETWHAWRNRAWPTIYLVDRHGMVRYRHIGEGAYEQTEATIRRLLAE